MILKRKVCVVITARPSYSRVKSALHAISQHSSLELQIVVAASALLERYGRVEAQIMADGFRIDSKVYMVLEGENPASMAKTTGLGIIELATVFGILKPDIVVTIADRFETLATAVAASYMGIPLAHIQGGEVTGSIDERVRHAVTKLADIHFPSSSNSAARLIKMGEDPDSIFVTGCPSIDIASDIKKEEKLSYNLYDTYAGVGPQVNIKEDFIVVMQHPVTTEFMETEEQIEKLLNAVMRVNMPAIWFWPNVDAGSDGTSKGIRRFRENFPSAKIHFFKNLNPKHFIELLLHAKCIVGNSSVGIRECAFLGIPAVNIGSRQFGRERAENVADVGNDENEIYNGILKAVSTHNFTKSFIYGDGTAGKKIADCLSKAKLSVDKKLLY
jgi:bifunctional UDP-N-acetylglucosamine 2-epimerase / N-acetylmannosamine kinase